MPAFMRNKVSLTNYHLFWKSAFKLQLPAMPFDDFYMPITTIHVPLKLFNVDIMIELSKKLIIRQSPFFVRPQLPPTWDVPTEELG